MNSVGVRMASASRFANGARFVAAFREGAQMPMVWGFLSTGFFGDSPCAMCNALEKP